VSLPNASVTSVPSVVNKVLRDFRGSPAPRSRHLFADWPKNLYREDPKPRTKHKGATARPVRSDLADRADPAEGLC